MTMRFASFAAGLSLAAAFVLALPLSVQAGGAHCNCGSARGSASAHVAVRTSAAVHVSASAYGRSGGGYAMHGGGYSRPVHYPSQAMHYPSQAMHYPTHYPAHPEPIHHDNGGYAYMNGNGDHRDTYHRDYGGRDYNDRAYNGGNSYSVVYAPSYGDDGYAAGDYAPPATADYAPQDYGQAYAPPAPDYGSSDAYSDAQPYDNGYANSDAQPYDSGYADTRYASDTRYSDATYTTATYDDAAYAPPPQVQGWRDMGGAWHCGCGAPVDSRSVTAYGWRDQYGDWHVTSQTRQSSYSYSYSR